MNLTSQYIVNPKSKITYSKCKASYKSIGSSTSRLRLNEAMTSLKPNRMRKIHFQIENICFEMIYCPRGTFEMGTDEPSYENPKRLMAIERSFLLGETEVTQELYEKIMGFNPSDFNSNRYGNTEQRPVEDVTWYDAVMFCNKLSTKIGMRPYYNISNITYEDNYISINIESAEVTINPNSNGFRLPSEKEWEYAAKAGTDNQWAGTNDVNKVKEIAWLDENSLDQTHPVKGKRPNEWGFYDMSGNVWEWSGCHWTKLETTYAIRGGNWGESDYSSKSVSRNYVKPAGHDNGVGFRIASSLVK